MFEGIRKMLDAAKAHRPECSRASLLLSDAGLHAAALQKGAYWCSLQGWSGLGAAVAWVNRFLTGLSARPTAKFGCGVYLSAPTGVVVDEGVVLGNDVEVGPGVMLLAADGSAPSIGEGAKIGAGARIVGGVVIAAGMVVPEGAVVTVLGEAAGQLPNQSEAKEQLGELSEKTDSSAAASHKREIDPAVKELVRVVREQNAVIAKLNSAIAALGGEALSEEDLPKISGRAAGVSTRRARHHRSKKSGANNSEAASS